MQEREGSFSTLVQQTVARRTGFRCSNPKCRKSTMGPHSLQPDGFEYVGEAAHICAQRVEGERYDPDQPREEREALPNAIHLCCTCHGLIDHVGAASNGYATTLLRQWKQSAEAQAESSLLRGETTERVIDELLSEIKLLMLRVAHLQEVVCQRTTPDAF
jgi:hypothetical protein